MPIPIIVAILGFALVPFMPKHQKGPLTEDQAAVVAWHEANPNPFNHSCLKK